MAKKQTITRDEYLQLPGLAVIAKRHYQGVHEARIAMHSVLGTSENDASDDEWIGEIVWNGDTDVDRMLKMMEVTIEESADANS